MFRFLIEICICLVIVPFLFWQLVWPLYKGQRPFPIFLKKKSVEIEKAIKTTNEAIETEEEKLILKQKKESLEKLKKSNTK